MTRVQFSVRRLMLATAIIAALLGLAAQLWNGTRDAGARARYLEASERHRLTAENSLMPQMHMSMSRKESHEAQLLSRSSTADPDWLVNDIGRLEEEIRSLELRAKYHLEMARKYQVAAEHPRRFVAPDPPEPK